MGRADAFHGLLAHWIRLSVATFYEITWSIRHTVPSQHSFRKKHWTHTGFCMCWQKHFEKWLQKHGKKFMHLIWKKQWSFRTSSRLGRVYCFLQVVYIIDHPNQSRTFTIIAFSFRHFFINSLYLSHEDLTPLLCFDKGEHISLSYVKTKIEYFCLWLSRKFSMCNLIRLKPVHSNCSAELSKMDIKRSLLHT